ncbi:CrcB protein [Acinetobacter calcoaceticus]|uniref:Fluoride-specific ion channel FluC n=1 Tax=Acinetobacter calcoaceticus TaxID=471 RepID=A0A4R1Y5D5_ACICA|nr:CrcB protein [Acinetobacter calcoaceticus]
MNWIWVACGGAIGASLRYALSLYLVKPQNLFPWPTWWINISGCVLAGIFFACTERYPILQQQTRLFFMVGILGGYTTFSSFGLETFVLLKQGHLMIALAYVISSVIVGVVGLAIGFYIFQILLK